MENLKQLKVKNMNKLQKLLPILHGIYNSSVVACISGRKLCRKEESYGEKCRISNICTHSVSQASTTQKKHVGKMLPSFQKMKAQIRLS
jgi:hypothetical protein